MDDLVIYPGKGKMLLIAAGSLMFVVLSWFLPATRDRVPLPRGFIVFIAYAGMVFFGLCLVYALYRLLSPKPAVIISRAGIFDNASASGAGMLSWEEIAEVYPYDLMGQRMLGIVPRDAAAVMARLPPLKRILAKMNRGLAQAPFNIPQAGLPVPVEELLREIEARRARH
jgi:hypothetical protein